MEKWILENTIAIHMYQESYKELEVFRPVLKLAGNGKLPATQTLYL